jgi:alkylation response protein AidB-like acyl-CoA dehydrogenase
MEAEPELLVGEGGFMQLTFDTDVEAFPTDSPGVARRPFASASGLDDQDFNEVFFTDVRVPAENLVGEINPGWRVATGSLGHERTMLWMGYADQLREMTEDSGRPMNWNAIATPRW